MERLLVEDLFNRGDRIGATRRAPEVEVALVERDLRLRTEPRADADTPPELTSRTILEIEPEVHQ